MAQKRMIDKKISVSEQVANLPIAAQLVYTWSLPHADDIGLLPKPHRTLKATVIPMVDMSTEEFGSVVAAILAQDLWEEYEFNGYEFYRIKKFSRYQTLKKDRQPQTLLPIEYHKSPLASWAVLEKLGFQLEDSGIHLDTEVKRREVKRREDKREDPRASISYLKEIPAEDMLEFRKRFVVSERQIKSKAEDLGLYCQRKGKVYKDYKAFLLNALKKDFPERPPEAVPQQKPAPDQPMTPEQKAQVEKIKGDIGQIAKRLKVAP